MQTTIMTVNIPEGHRILMTSDIHGHGHYLKNLLAKVNYSVEDILFIIGDIIEKGPRSLKTLRYIMELCRRGTVYVLMGNVDAWRLLMLDDDQKSDDRAFYQYILDNKRIWGGCLFLDMCEEMNLAISGPADMPAARALMRDRYKIELDFLRGLPTIIETQRFICVHGGLVSDHLEQCRQADAMTLLKNDAFMEKGLSFQKYVIVGHWPVTLYDDKIPSANPIVSRDQKIISIDGGCGLKRDGQLNMLILPAIRTRDFAFADYDEFPVAIALTPQEQSDHSFYIRYTDHDITVLKREVEFSYAQHDSTGYRMWIHNDFIESNDKNTVCDDYTDYHLPVSRGDRLSIVKETSRGYLAKKNGVSGWYCGSIAYE